MSMKEQEKSQVNHPTGRYVTIEEAAAEAGVAERTIQRWKKAGKIHVIRDRLRHIRVSLEDVMACRHEASESPLRAQVQQLQTQTATLLQRVARLEEDLEEQSRQQNLGEQLVQALTSRQEEADAKGAWSLLATLVEASHHSRASAGGLPAMLAKRGLPLDGTRRLSDFATAHTVSIHEIKKLYETGAIELTVYQRPGEHKRNKQEWWISLSQQQSLIAYWQQHGISYTACPHCPHVDTSTALAS